MQETPQTPHSPPSPQSNAQAPDGGYNPYAPPAEPAYGVPEGELLSGGAILAGRGARLGAAIIDGLVVSVINVPLAFALGFVDLSGRQPSFLTQLASLGLGIVVLLLVHVWFMPQGQTLGKKALGIRIVDMSTEQPLPVGKLLAMRYGPLWLVALIPFVGGIAALVDVLFIFGEDRRCVHDLIAGTKVVDATSAPVG